MKDREPKPSRTASLFFAGLAAASLGLAACQRQEESQGPSRTLPSTKSGGPDQAPTARVVPTVAQPRAPEAQKPAAAAAPAKPPELPLPVPVEKPVEPGWTRFTSERYPFQIDYPPSWKVSIYYTGQESFLAPEKGGVLGGSLALVQVMVKPMPGATIQEFAKDAAISSGTMPDQVVSSPIIVSGQRALLITLSPTVKESLRNRAGMDLLGYQVVFVYKNQGWRIGLFPAVGADVYQLDYYLPNFKKMLETFRLLQ